GLRRRQADHFIPFTRGVKPLDFVQVGLRFRMRRRCGADGMAGLARAWHGLLPMSGGLDFLLSKREEN
ncbi:MAG: hypothetical protein ACRD18_16330, partial [Terriglobia bacterium]